MRSTLFDFFPIDHRLAVEVAIVYRARKLGFCPELQNPDAAILWRNKTSVQNCTYTTWQHIVAEVFWDSSAWTATVRIIDNRINDQVFLKSDFIDAACAAALCKIDPARKPEGIDGALEFILKFYSKRKLGKNLLACGPRDIDFAYKKLLQYEKLFRERAIIERSLMLSSIVMALRKSVSEKQNGLEEDAYLLTALAQN